MIVSFCGIDGSGKSTVLTIVKGILEKKGYDVSIIDFMKNGNLTEEFNYLLQEKTNFKKIQEVATLKSAAHALDLYLGINKLKTENNYHTKIYLSHRMDMCFRVYANLCGANIKYLSSIVKKMPTADLYVYINIEPEIAVERIGGRSEPLSWKETEIHLKTASVLYEQFLESVEGKLVVINNNQEIKENEIKNVIEKIDEFYRINRY
ncbi:hypothetical protein HB853_14565 [Listeria welshimeri]|uniref:Thymidylate kinase-like domain-containing protein n=1 Tax=Listeria welshimeri TaxID=1643 RepID=A0A7X0TC46_LISWE|nr:hypothetical protein [Listeria welshimeri]